MNQIALAIDMLFILKTQGIVKKEFIASQLEISEKMVQRLRNQLELVGYEIEIERGKYGGYRLINSSFFPVTDLNSEELQVLSKTYASLLSLESPFINNEFKKAFSKIIGNSQNNLPGVKIIQTQQLKIEQEKLETLISQFQSSIMKRNIVTIKYNNHKQYVFEPYEIFQVDAAWYVIGYQRYNDVRIFRLDRIISIDIHDKTFIRVKNFNLNTHLGAQGFKIEDPILLIGTLKNTNFLQEFIISDHQIIKGNKIEIKFYSLSRAKRFVLEQGSQLIIESPIELKNFQKEEAQKVLSQL